MSKVLSLSEHTGRSTLTSPEQALESALEMIGQRGAFEHGKKLMIIALDDKEGQYGISFVQAGMRMSECVALCEVAKIEFLRQMNMIPE